MFDLRSYERNECIAKKQDLLCVLKNEEGKILGQMNIPLRKLKQKKWIEHIERDIPSKIYPNQFYDLLSIKWKPDKVLSNEDIFKKSLGY
jgi:hypothetical protein